MHVPIEFSNKEYVLVCVYVNSDVLIQLFFFKKNRARANVSIMVYGILSFTIKKPQSCLKHLLYLIKFYKD